MAHSISKGHEISELATVRAHYKALGLAIRIRFRGPRAHTIGMRMPSGFRRTSTAARQDCLKADATGFSVYPR